MKPFHLLVAFCPCLLFAARAAAEAPNKPVARQNLAVSSKPNLCVGSKPNSSVGTKAPICLFAEMRRASKEVPTQLSVKAVKEVPPAPPVSKAKVVVVVLKQARPPVPPPAPKVIVVYVKPVPAVKAVVVAPVKPKATADLKPNLPPARTGVVVGKGGATTEELTRTGSPVIPEEEKVAAEE